MATRRTKKSSPSPSAPAPRGFTKLVLDNVRCFARAEIPLGARVTVIIGHNGAGKTTIAEAIASLAPGKDEGLEVFPLRHGASRGAIALHGDSADPLARWRSGSLTPERLPFDRHVFVYGQYRALRPPRRSPAPPVPSFLQPELHSAVARPLPDDLVDAVRRPATRTLFDFDEYLFRDLAAYVALLAARGEYDPAARRAWGDLRAWLNDLDGPRFDDVEIVEEGGRRVAAFRRAGVALPITDLSDGYRAMLAIVLDLAIRFTQMFPAREDPLAGEALVVIDEIDLNLHPRWQRHVIDQLTRLFPRVQFVLTTHSATVVQAAIDRGYPVVGLDEKPGEGTLPRLIKARLDGAEVDSVLVEAFGLPSRYSPKYEEKEKEAATLRAKIEDGTATAADRKKLLGVLDGLQLLLAREEEREGTGPLMSEIARSQIAFLRSIEAAKKGGRRGSLATKRR